MAALFSKSRLGKLLHKLKKIVAKNKKSKKPKQSNAQEGQVEDTIPQIPSGTVAVTVPTTSSAVSVQSPGINTVPQADNDVPQETTFPWAPPRELETLIQHNTALASTAPPNFRLVMTSHSPLLNEDDIDLRVIKQKVVLEYCIHGHNTLLTGVIRAHNICYHKYVFVRITQDYWKTFKDIKADYINSDGSSDRFEFAFTVTDDASGNDLQFAVCYQSEAGEFWDNNDKENYVLQFRYSTYH